MRLGYSWLIYLTNKEIRELSEICGVITVNILFDSFEEFIGYQFKYLYETPPREIIDYWINISKRNV